MALPFRQKSMVNKCVFIMKLAKMCLGISSIMILKKSIWTIKLSCKVENLHKCVLSKMVEAISLHINVVEGVSGLFDR